MIKLNSIAKSILWEDTQLIKEKISNKLYNSIKDTDYIHLTKDSKLKLTDTEQDDSKSGFGIYKPNGLWFGLGTSWIDWVRSAMPVWEYSNVFKLDLNESKILMLNNEKDMPDEYMIKGKFPSWILISKDYSGIILENPSYGWSYGWDIPSGCVWDTDAVRGVNQLSN